MKRTLFERVEDLSFITRYALVILITLLITAVWYEVFYRPVQKRLVRSRDEIATLRKRARMVNNMNQQTGNVGKYEIVVNKKVLAELKRPFEIDDAIDYMLHQALQIGIHIDNCISQGERKKEWYTVSPVLFNMQGTFDALQEFFEVISNSNFLVRCGPVSLVRDDDNRVSLRCIMNYYHLESDE